jgi:hypothetical protein
MIADDLLTVSTFGGALPNDLLEAARGRLSEVLGRNIGGDDRPRAV